jgi:hypothetical protein
LLPFLFLYEAYLFGIFLSRCVNLIASLEKNGDFEEEPHGKSDRSREGDCTELETSDKGRSIKI